MIGIVLPSIDTMTVHPDHPMKTETDTIIPELFRDEEPGLWLCIGGHEDIVPKDPSVFRTSLLRVGDGSGDEQVTGVQEPVTAFGPVNHRRSPVRRESL